MPQRHPPACRPGMGLKACLRKPFHDQDLIAALQRVLSQRRAEPGEYRCLNRLRLWPRRRSGAWCVHKPVSRAHLSHPHACGTIRGGANASITSRGDMVAVMFLQAVWTEAMREVGFGVAHDVGFQNLPISLIVTNLFTDHTNRQKTAEGTHLLL